MSASAPAPRRPRRRRRLVFALVLLALMWLLLEALAFVGYSALRGELFSFAKLHRAQAERAKLAATADAGNKLAMQDSGGDTCIHPYLGFVANFDTDDQLLHWLKDHAITRWGFIDQRGIVRQRDPRAVLVGLFGGSVAEFFGDDGADELAKVLRQDARFADKRIEFVRMGLGGFKQPQQLFALTYLLSLGGELDFAINIDGFNEATLGPLENAPRGVPTFFPRNWALLAEAAPDPKQRRRIGAHTVFEAWRQDLAGGFAAGPWRWSVIGNTLWDAADRWLARKAADQLVALQSEVRQDLPFHITGPGAEPGNDDARGQVTIETWARCSVAMHNICTAHGIRYYHFLQPNQYLPQSKVLTAQELGEAFDPNSRYRPWIERTYPKQRAQQDALVGKGVRFADMTQVFAAVADTVYVDNCCHYNALGNRILGRALAQTILRDLGGGSPAETFEISALRVEPATVRCTTPLSAHELRVFARTAQGERDVTYGDIRYVSADPNVARVDDLGVVTATAQGKTEIAVTAGGKTVAVPVEVTLAPLVDLGGGYAPRPLRVPALRAHEEAGQLILHVAGPGLPGVVTIATSPTPRPYCGGRAFVPLQGVQVEALPAADGELRMPLRMPPEVRSVYVQAVYRVSAEVCGFAISNGMVVTR